MSSPLGGWLQMKLGVVGIRECVAGLILYSLASTWAPDEGFLVVSVIIDDPRVTAVLGEFLALSAQFVSDVSGDLLLIESEVI